MLNFCLQIMIALSCVFEPPFNVVRTLCQSSEDVIKGALSWLMQIFGVNTSYLEHITAYYVHGYI